MNLSCSLLSTSNVFHSCAISKYDLASSKILFHNNKLSVIKHNRLCLSVTPNYLHFMLASRQAQAEEMNEKLEASRDYINKCRYLKDCMLHFSDMEKNHKNDSHQHHLVVPLCCASRTDNFVCHLNIIWSDEGNNWNAFARNTSSAMLLLMDDQCTLRNSSIELGIQNINTRPHNNS